MHLLPLKPLEMGHSGYLDFVLIEKLWRVMCFIFISGVADNINSRTNGLIVEQRLDLFNHFLKLN